VGSHGESDVVVPLTGRSPFMHGDISKLPGLPDPTGDHGDMSIEHTCTWWNYAYGATAYDVTSGDQLSGCRRRFLVRSNRGQDADFAAGMSRVSESTLGGESDELVSSSLDRGSREGSR
jgi:hypothetical protein